MKLRYICEQLNKFDFYFVCMDVVYMYCLNFVMLFLEIND